MELVDGADGDPNRVVSRSGRIAEGVPLSRLIKSEISEIPELVMLSQPRSLSAERFRRLKTTLVNRFGAELQVIVVTSGAPGEGKSTIALNLALALGAELDDKTLLIDADLRRPSIGALLQPAPKLGLREVLTKLAPLEHAVLELKNSALEILPAGSKTEAPLELLTAQEARSLISGLRERYRWIIIDTPPIVPFTDADALGALSDGILMVVRARSTPESVYQQAVSAVTSTRILGAVLNDSPRSLSDSGAYYDRYYRAYFDREHK